MNFGILNDLGTDSSQHTLNFHPSTKRHPTLIRLSFEKIKSTHKNFIGKKYMRKSGFPVYHIYLLREQNHILRI